MNDQDPKKQQEPIILELDDRLEFGAVVVDSGDPTALGLDQIQCQCNTVAGCGAPLPQEPQLGG